MPFRSPFPGFTAWTLRASLVASSACIGARLGAEQGAAAGMAETAPLIPPVASIPVAPVGAPPPAAANPFQEATSAAAPAQAPAVAEAMPAASSALRVVLVDELPFRWSPALAKEESEHEHTRRGRNRGRGGRPYHPAPGVVVDVADAPGGGASAAELQRAARNAAYWPFRRCYEEGLRRDQRLGGRVLLHVTVAANGATERASVGSATLGDESVVLCIGREASHLTLAPGPFATNAEMKVTLSTGDEAVPAPYPVACAEELREALRASWPAVEQCYAGELAKHPDAGGRMELRFRAKSNGEIVEVAEESERRFPAIDVTRCVLGTYRTAKLSAARGCSPRETSFVYAIHFEAETSRP
jgi:hypothetical protein